MANEEIKLLFKLSGPGLERDEVVVGRQGLRVGRSSDNNLALNHREISRQHMRITWREDDKYLVEDLNSSNGVWLNEIRLVTRIAAELNVGDIIRVGPFLMTLDELVYEQVIDSPSVDSNGMPRAVPHLPAQIATSYTSMNGDTPQHRTNLYLPGIPIERSNWMQYLPEVFDEHEFMGRFLLIFESLLAPVIWTIDNFDMYLSPEVAPEEWLQWMSSWFDVLVLPDLPKENQRHIVQQIGWLFLRRGTPSGLQRLLELYFGVTPEIIEDADCHFTVRIALSESNITLGKDVLDRLINSQRPAFASYTLEIL